MNSLIDKIACLIFITVVTILLLSVPAMTQEKKSEKDQSTAKKDVQPPEGEMWYEEGDEELFKYEINPITPKEGITGGILIYYGHYVRPPYKVEIKDDIVLVNGLPIERGPRDVYERIKARWDKKQEARLAKYRVPEEIKKRDLKNAEIASEILQYAISLVKKYGGYEENQELIDRMTKEYIKNHPGILECIFYDAFSFRLKFVNSPDEWMPIEGTVPHPMPTKEKLAREREELLKLTKKIWEELLSSKITYQFFGILQTWNEPSDFIYISKILQRTDIDAGEKAKIINENIRRLILDQIKLLVYNFNYEQFLRDIKDQEENDNEK